VESLREDKHPRHTAGVLRFDATQHMLYDPLLSQFDNLNAPDLALMVKICGLIDHDSVSLKAAEQVYRLHESNWTDSKGERNTKPKKIQERSTALQTKLVSKVNGFLAKLNRDEVVMLQKLKAEDRDRFKKSSDVQFIFNVKYGYAAAIRDLEDTAIRQVATSTTILKGQCNKLKGELDA
jgi:hypothetical protein